MVILYIRRIGESRIKWPREGGGEVLQHSGHRQRKRERLSERRNTHGLPLDFFCARRTQIISRKRHPTFSCEATQRLTGGNTGEIWGEVLCEPDGALLALEVLHAESKGEV